MNIPRDTLCVFVCVFVFVLCVFCVGALSVLLCERIQGDKYRAYVCIFCINVCNAYTRSLLGTHMLFSPLPSEAKSSNHMCNMLFLTLGECFHIF